MADVHGSGVVIEDLTDAECRSLLDRSSVGRVGVTIEALPVILPVNFAMFEDTVIFRSTPGTKLSTALRKTVVAFEVDDYDPNGDRGWSVLVRGRAHEVTDPDAVAQLRGLPLRFLSPGGTEDHFIQIAMTKVTGRRIRPVYPG